MLPSAPSALLLAVLWLAAPAAAWEVEAELDPFTADLGLPDDYWVLHDGSGTQIGAGDDTASGGVACTLRDALGVANSGRVGDGCEATPVGRPAFDDPYVIPLPADPYTYTLAGTSLVSSGRAWVVGAGPEATILQGAAERGAGLEGVIKVLGGDLFLHRLTVRFGSSPLAGGGLRIVGAAVTIDGCRIEDNESSADGGGIASTTGPVPTIRASIIRRNRAAGVGGGVSGGFAIHGSLIADNEASSGGGLHSNRNSILEASTVADNRAAIDGGGWLNQAAERILGVTFVRNVAQSGSGGGMLIDDAPVAVNNTTFARNQAGQRGGGIQVGTGAAEGGLHNVTLAENVASVAGGGLASDGTPVAYGNSIVADNLAPAGADCDLAAGSVSTLGFNVLGAGCDGGADDQVGVAAGLGAFGDHGGVVALPDGSHTETFALAADSVAVDGGDPGGCEGEDLMAPLPLDTDQRGVPRLDGDGDGTVRCDVGAYERVPVLFADGFESGDTSAWSATVP